MWRVCRLVCQLPAALKRGLADNPRIPVLTLFTKDDCTLCDQAMETLKPYQHLYRLEMVDITKPENADWLRRYRFDIPVFHLNGTYLMKHKADVGKLHRALKDFHNSEPS